MQIERVSVLQLRSRLNTGKPTSNFIKLLSQSYSAVGPSAESPHMFLNSIRLFATHLNTRVWGLKLYMAKFVSLRDGRTRSFEYDHFIADGNYGPIHAVKEKKRFFTHFFKSKLLVLKSITMSAEKLRDQAEKRAVKTNLTYDALIKLKHENIVKYYDYGKSDNERVRPNTWYSLQEFLPGKWSASWPSNVYVCAVGNVCMSTLNILQKKKVSNSLCEPFWTSRGYLECSLFY